MSNRMLLMEVAGSSSGDPYGTRTRISSLRGWRPNRLDEGTIWRYGPDSNRRLTVLQTVLLNLLSTVSWLG